MADHTSGTPPVTGPLELASPLSLLMTEEQYGDGQAREVLLLSYSADLGFFETFALGLSRACGARTALISDARMTSADPRAARTAGRAYLPGLAHCSGAFHPKLVLIAGAQRVVAAIGSGNATLSGWQANAELWTVHRGDPTGCPAILGELSTWLRALPEAVRLSRGSGNACADAADQIDQLIGEAPATDPQVRLVSSLTTPIIGELPDGPVDELAVSAPFHDSGALALRALVERLDPQQVTLTYQPKLTVLDQPAVAQLAAELTAAGRQVRILTDLEQERYRHGKLVEWSVGGQRWALTGSPNLSGRALLETVASGGNCELGVICPISETLLPAGADEPASAMRPAHAGPRTDRGSGPVLLGATRSGNDTLHIQLGRKLQGPDGQVSISPVFAPPESWDWLAVVPTGATDLEVFIDLPAASRVRVSQPGPDGQLRHSNVVAVLDEVRARAQHTNPFASPQPRTQPVDLFTDAQLARRFVDEMVAFTSRHPTAPAAAPSSATRDDITSSPTATKSWQAYLDECAGRMGQPLLNFALGLLLPVGEEPTDTGGDTSPGSGPDIQVTVVDWLEDAGDDREAGLSSDTVEEAASSRIDPGTGWVVLDLARESGQMRRAYQRYAARLAEAGERRGATVVDLLSITRMILMIAAGGAWRDEDPERWRLLARSLRALAKVDLRKAEGSAASLTAVVLSVFRSAAPRGSHGDLELLYEDVTGAVAHLLPAAQPELVAGYAQWLEPAFGLAVDVDVVLDRAAALVQDDPIDDALWLLQDRGRDVHRHGEQLLHVTGRFPNAILVALAAVGAAERSPRVGAWAGQAGQSWALCVWEPPNLYVVVPGKPRYRWRHYRFPGLSGPATAAAQGELPAHFLVPHGPQNQPIADAEEALARLSLNDPQPPD